MRTPAKTFIAFLLITAISATMAPVQARRAASPAPGSVLFQEDFEAFAVGEPWLDGTRHGAWTSTYNGYGVNQVVGEASKHLAQAPLASTQPDETHASLITTRKSFTDIDFTVRAKTVAHLRAPAPNPWETAWVLWNYTDDLHFYYLALKPNGWELGKEDPAYPGAQRFLATGSDPTYPVGSWNKVRIIQRGAHIVVEVNGTQIVSFVDNERPYLGGRIGLYNEDADVRFDDIVVRVPQRV
ncbi:MAG TPA: DUF1080 domain-containing protein [Actinomycetota bacterium]|nr:DUF1080 domain-containing protein [Actinomycetota bacterium]